MDFELTEEQKMFWDSIADFCDHEIAPLVDEAEAKEEFPFPSSGNLVSGFLCCGTRSSTAGRRRTKSASASTWRIEPGLLRNRLQPAGPATWPHLRFSIWHGGTETEVPGSGDPRGEDRMLCPYGAQRRFGRGQHFGQGGQRRDEYRINGRKIFITNASMADYCIVAAYTDPARRGPDQPLPGGQGAPGSK